MTKTSTNYGIWWKTPFCISSDGVELRLAMRNAPRHSLPPSIFAALHCGRLSRDDNI